MPAKPGETGEESAAASRHCGRELKRAGGELQWVDEVLNELGERPTRDDDGLRGAAAELKEAGDGWSSVKEYFVAASSVPAID